MSLRTRDGHPDKYLHSHWDLFPVGAGAWQQMVGCYAHHDHNNLWRIRRLDSSEDTEDTEVTVRDGDEVILTHEVTGRNLHSHDVPALGDKRLRQVTGHNKTKTRANLNHVLHQVTGYGEAGWGDSNDVWVVGVSGGGALTPGSALTLTHKLLGCVLADTAKALPKEWGYQLSQVVCSPWRRRVNENYGMFVSS